VHLDEPVLVGRRAVDDDEDEVVVLVQLRALAEVLRVFDRERVEPEFLTQELEVADVGVVQVEPEEVRRREQLPDRLVVEVQLARAVVLEDSAGLGRSGRARDRTRWARAVVAR
jgi:hypothetical protein